MDVNKFDITSKGRETCWNNRDAFYECIDTYRGTEIECKKQYEAYKDTCIPTWVIMSVPNETN